jgi:hypothetical protein
MIYFCESAHDYAIHIGEIFLFIFGWDLVFGLATSGICKLMNFLMNAHWVYSYFQYFDFWNSTFLRSLFFSLVGVEDNRVITVSVRYYIEVFWLCRCTMQIRWFPWPPPKFTEINAESFECSITIPCVGAFLCTQQVWIYLYLLAEPVNATLMHVDVDCLRV